jgi:hypothetical protein
MFTEIGIYEPGSFPADTIPAGEQVRLAKCLGGSCSPDQVAKEFFLRSVLH